MRITVNLFIQYWLDAVFIPLFQVKKTSSLLVFCEIIYNGLFECFGIKCDVHSATLQYALLLRTSPVKPASWCMMFPLRNRSIGGIGLFYACFPGGCLVDKFPVSILSSIQYQCCMYNATDN